MCVQEFFRSDYFIDVGARGLMHKIRRAVEATLAGEWRAQRPAAQPPVRNYSTTPLSCCC
jgi:hypothetical protein